MIKGLRSKFKHALIKGEVWEPAQEIANEDLVALAETTTLVFIGATAAGKDTIMKSVSIESGTPVMLSHTTRPMRECESDGEEYNFVSDERFDEVPMVESRTYNTAGADRPWRYGLSEATAGEHGLLILDWQGFKDFRDWRKRKGLAAPDGVFVDVDKETSRQRQVNRGDYNNAEFERRWESDLSWVEEAEVGCRWKIGIR